MIKEFRTFIMRGSVLDLAIGVIIGAAFGAIVTSLVTNIIMPPIGLILGGVDFSQIKIVLQQAGAKTLADGTPSPEVAIGIGLFINAVITFLIIALVVFLIVRAVNKLMPPPPPPPAPGPTTEEKMLAQLEKLNETMARK
ncbi:MAG: large-conductance mechanosensitive channel protein MscL [Anaerolineae bacterium]|nr:large-conductance mechanosensitive channel protein MscL [Anaerolineae bacterium]